MQSKITPEVEAGFPTISNGDNLLGITRGQLDFRLSMPMRNLVIGPEEVRLFLARHTGAEHLLNVISSELDSETPNGFNTLISATFKPEIKADDLSAMRQHAWECLLLGYFPARQVSRAEQAFFNARDKFEG